MNTKRVELRHAGAMRFDAETGSGHTVVFDDREGDAGPGPTEVLASALAACTGMDVVSIMNKKRQAYDSYTIHVEATARDEYPQVFTRIDIVHEVVGPGVEVSQVRRCVELSATKYCPISAMLAAGETEIHHRYHVVRTGELGFDEAGEVLTTGPYRPPTVILD